MPLKTLTPLTTAAATLTGVAVDGPGRQILYFSGTWGGGTLTVTFSPTAGGTYVPIGSGVTATGDGNVEFDCGTGFLKFVLSGSSGATVNLFLECIFGRGSNWR